MALNTDNKPKFATKLNLGSGDIIPATGANTMFTSANVVTVFTAGAKGALVDSIRVHSSDSANKILHLYILSGGIPLLVGAYTIPLGSGTNGTAVPFDVLSNVNSPHLPINNQGKRYIRVPASATLIAGVFAAVTAAKQITVVCSGLDFE